MLTKINNFKTLQDDLTFKYVFSKEEILNDLVKSFLEYVGINKRVVLANIKVQDYKLPNKQILKGIYPDLIAILDDGTIINIEMYKNKFTKREYKKSISYLSKLISDQMEKGNQKYEDIKKVIGISFMKGNYQRKNTEIVNSYELENKITQKVIDEGDIELYLVRLDLEEKVRYNVYESKRFIRWIQMLNAKTIEELEEIGKGDRIMENSIRVVKEWLGRKSGYETYLEEKEWEAKEEGSKETSLTIAKNMLDDGMSINKIIKLTGLTKNQILSIDIRKGKK